MGKRMNQNFPGGSKSRVNIAGARIRAGRASEEDLRVVEVWRAAHRAVLNTFQAILRMRTRNSNVTVAQRHKRKRTIFDKLSRLPGMQLSRMDDVAGCRLIFPSLEALYEFRVQFQNANFRHKRRNSLDKYDYIAQPKRSGYRGIHDIYEYEVRSTKGKDLTGLYVEIQYRTLVQHAWATAVEVIGFITESQPKFERGDTRYQDAMALASEILARAHEGLKGPFPELSGEEVVRRFGELDRELALLNTLRGLNASHADGSEKKNTILIFSDLEELETRHFRDATDAMKELFQLELEFPEKDIVLVRADTSEEVRTAFRNYFSDAQEFVAMVEEGTRRLGAV
jgi:putative GTP pyrophosphokinase